MDVKSTPIEVWVIEFCQNIDGIVERDVQTVRSSRERAIEWCKANTDIEGHSVLYPWWFSVYREVVDHEDEENFLFSVDWHGKALTDTLVPSYGWTK